MIIEFFNLRNPTMMNIGNRMYPITVGTSIRRANDSEIKEAEEKAEWFVRAMESGNWDNHREPDYERVRCLQRDNDDRRLFHDEYPDLKIKFRKNRIWK